MPKFSTNVSCRKLFCLSTSKARRVGSSRVGVTFDRVTYAIRERNFTGRTSDSSLQYSTYMRIRYTARDKGGPCCICFTFESNVVIQ